MKKNLLLARRAFILLFAIFLCPGLIVKADTYGIIYSFVERVMTATGQEYQVTVQYDKLSGIPVGSELKVREVEKGSQEYERYLAAAKEQVEGRITDAGFLDIELVKDGVKIEPKTPVTVEIRKISTSSIDGVEEEDASVAAEEPLLASFSEESIEEESLADEMLEAAETVEASTVNILHIQDEEEMELIENVVSNEEMMVFQAESFSIYGVIYTVDFHWDVDGKEYTFSILGGDSISLQNLLEMLNVLESNDDLIDEDISTNQISENHLDELDLFIENIETVEFSSKELIWVGKIEEDSAVDEIVKREKLEVHYSGLFSEEEIEELKRKRYLRSDWVLISLQPFDTEEKLTITLKTGDVVEIIVTDVQSKDPLGLDGQIFAILNSNTIMQNSSGNGSIYATYTYSNPQTANISWTIEYDKYAFDGNGGYYLHNGTNYICGNGAGGLQLNNKLDANGNTQALPFKIQYNDTKVVSNNQHERGGYRFSTDLNDTWALTCSGNNNNNWFNITNSTLDNTWMSLQNPASVAGVPATVATWDIINDEIKLQMFDYQGTVSNGANIDKTWGADGNNISNAALWRGGTGINKERSLLFSGSGLGTGVEIYNQFTGSQNSSIGPYYSGYIRPGIVKPNLGSDGFPGLTTIASGANRDTADGGSLGYLFGTKNTSDGVWNTEQGVRKFTNGGKGLQGLLRKDSKGYYYYDSEDNYAILDSVSANAKELILYSDTYKKNDGSSEYKRQKIGFFPFDSYNTNNREEKTPANGGVYSHQFGMSLATKFVYPKDGKVPETGENMIFEFSGDDDVWVFVDGVLLLDIGGVHQPIRGKIDFGAKTVTVWEFSQNGVENPTSVSFQSLFNKAYDVGGTKDKFDDTEYSSHTLKFFYLERGGCDSNLALSFNLMIMKNLSVKKKLYGLTSNEKDKYQDVDFDFEIDTRADSDWDGPNSNISLSNEQAVWSNETIWRQGFSPYETGYVDSINENLNHTIYYPNIDISPTPTPTKGVPIDDGEFLLKDRQMMYIYNLPKRNFFYTVQENGLDVNMFEAPYALRKYTDTDEEKTYEVKVNLHQDGENWETKPFATMYGDKLTYFNTLKEKNLDVIKLWSDEDTHNPVTFKLEAYVGEKTYAEYMGDYNIANSTTYSTNINAQSTIIFYNSATPPAETSRITTTENVLDKEYTLSDAHQWEYLFEHLPKETPDSKEITYTVKEVKVPDGYTSSISVATDTEKVYLDIYKLWEDGNEKHDGNPSTGEDAEVITPIETRVKDEDGKYIVATLLSNGEYKYTGTTTDPNAATRFLLTSKAALSYSADQKTQLDYAARVNNLPKGTYTLDPVNSDTLGLVCFTRPEQKIEIKNETTEIIVDKKWVDAEGNTLPSHPEAISVDIYRAYHVHTWNTSENDGWVVTTPATETSLGVEKRTCSLTGCGYSETRSIEYAGHDFVFQRLVAATCEIPAYKVYACSHNPEHIKIEYVGEALGHTWGEWEKKIDPTCTEEGMQLRKCTLCGKEYAETEEALGHSWSQWALDEGSDPLTISRVCSRCEEKETRNIQDESEIAAANAETPEPSEEYTPRQYLPSDLVNLNKPENGNFVEIYRYEKEIETTEESDNYVDVEKPYWEETMKLPKYDDSGNIYTYYVFENNPKKGYVTKTQYYAPAFDQQGNVTGYDDTDEIDMNDKSKVEFVNTFDFPIYKTDSDGDRLSGAIFKLTYGSNGTIVYVKEKGTDYTAHTAVILEPVVPDTNVSINDDHNQFTLTDNGLKISGLSSGTYKLVEVKAPDGYVMTNPTTEFKVEDGYIKKDGELIYDYSIINEPGVELPATGGPGLAGIYLLGALLTTMAAFVLLLKRSAIIN